VLGSGLLVEGGHVGELDDPLDVWKALIDLLGDSIRKPD
jgi:hypothetical protein